MINFVLRSFLLCKKEKNVYIYIYENPQALRGYVWISGFYFDPQWGMKLTKSSSFKGGGYVEGSSAEVHDPCF